MTVQVPAEGRLFRSSKLSSSPGVEPVPSDWLHPLSTAEVESDPLPEIGNQALLLP